MSLMETSNQRPTRTEEEVTEEEAASVEADTEKTDGILWESTAHCVTAGWRGNGVGKRLIQQPFFIGFSPSKLFCWDDENNTMNSRMNNCVKKTINEQNVARHLSDAKRVIKVNRMRVTADKCLRKLFEFSNKIQSLIYMRVYSFVKFSTR